jgi:hypothetical protein
MLADVESVLKLPTAAASWLHRGVFDRLRSRIGGVMKAAAVAAGGIVRRGLAPAAEQGPVRGLVLDLTRSRCELLAENTFLRHQLLVAARRVKRPNLRAADRLVLGLAALFANWRNALVLVEPGRRGRCADYWSTCCAASKRGSRRTRCCVSS